MQPQKQTLTTETSQSCLSLQVLAGSIEDAYARSVLAAQWTEEIRNAGVAAAVVFPGLPVAAAPRGEGESILLVDDDQSMLELCAYFLKSLGYQVQTAEAPGEALNRMRGPARDIRLLLTDVVMPEMDGLQLARRVCALKPDIRVMFMSGHTSELLAERGVLEQNVMFLAKPFTRMELALKVRETLSMARTA